MGNPFLKELVNRLINYLIRISKGESYQEKIVHLLRKTLLFSFMALLLCGTMTSKYLVADWYLADLEKSVVKIDQFMGTQQENMNQLFRINADQYSTVIKLGRENKALKADMQQSLRTQKRLEYENRVLRDRLKEQGK